MYGWPLLEVERMYVRLKLIYVTAAACIPHMSSSSSSRPQICITAFICTSLFLFLFFFCSQWNQTTYIDFSRTFIIYFSPQWGLASVCVCARACVHACVCAFVWCTIFFCEFQWKPQGEMLHCCHFMIWQFLLLFPFSFSFLPLLSFFPFPFPFTSVTLFCPPYSYFVKQEQGYS